MLKYEIAEYKTELYEFKDNKFNAWMKIEWRIELNKVLNIGA